MGLTPEPSHAPYPDQPHSGTSGIPAMPQGQAAKPVPSQRPAMPPLPMRPQDPAMPQRPAPRPTGYPSYPTALPPSTTSRRVPPRPILQNHAIPSTGPYSIPGFRPAPVYRMPAQRVTSPEITRQCHYRHRACCRICGTCGGCRCREKTGRSRSMKP